MQLKQLLLALTILCTWGSLFAGHEKGGVIITYKSLASITGDSLDYEVTVHQIYATNGINPPQTYLVDLESGCFPNQLLSLDIQTRKGGSSIVLPDAGTYCDPYNTTLSYYGVVTYKKTIKLPGLCADFAFKTLGGFGAYNNFINMSNDFSTPAFETKLNNLYGPNDSPQILLHEIISLRCLNTPVNLYDFKATNADSVFFEFDEPRKSGSGNQSFSYASGYSVSNPLNATGGVMLDSSSGTLTATPNRVGSFLICLKWEEYRKDTAGMTRQVGSGQIITELIVSASCVNKTFELLQASGGTVDSVNCGDNTLSLMASRRFFRNSLSSDLSEFNLSAQKDPGLTVVGYTIQNDSTLELKLSGKIRSGEQLQLTVDQGSDSNTIYSICGKELVAGGQTINYAADHGPLPQSSINYQSSFLQVTFDGSGSQNSDLHIWDYGDGSPLDTAITQSYSYSQAGTYQVKLTTISDCGDSSTTTIPVEVCAVPDTNINLSSTGDTLGFNIVNNGAGDSFYWDFGDGDSARGASVSHLYSVDGNYQVTLTAVTSCGDSVVTQVTVNACSTPYADWKANRSNAPGGGYFINFDGTASRNFDHFRWDFGDGKSDTTTLTPSHLYVGDPSNYLVSLELWNDCGKSDTLSYSLAEIGQSLLAFPELRIYPNPVRHTLKLDFHEDNYSGAVEIIDQQGRLVFRVMKEQHSRHLELSLNELPAGHYTLKLGDGPGFRFNFIKQ